MIEPEDYRLPKKEKPKPKRKASDCEQTVKWLEEHMPFRPFTCEW